MKSLLRVSMILLIPTLGLSSCKPKETLQLQSKKILDYFNNSKPEKKTEDNKEKSFKLLLSQVSKEDLQDAVESMSEDIQDNIEYVPLSEYELSLKRQGIECVKCDANAEDPNMRYQ
jgi:hypothetical protein